MKAKVYLVCGVSGSGKTWVCRQLLDKFTYVPHDEHYNDQSFAVQQASKGGRPVITESPFGERLVRSEMELLYGLEVIPVFVITPVEQVAQQYHAREGKYLPQAARTRAGTIINRAIEWKAFHGSSEEVLAYLQSV